MFFILLFGVQVMRWGQDTMYAPQIKDIHRQLGQDPSTKKFILKVIQDCSVSLVVDAEALNILSEDKNA